MEYPTSTSHTYPHFPTFSHTGCIQSLSRPLEDGDIINIDITVYLNGYHGDTSQTFFVGDVVCPLCKKQKSQPDHSSRTRKAGPS